MQVIKKVLIILYTLFLGVIVFCNTSVFADDIDTKYKFVDTVSNGYDLYWINTQDKFDYNMFYSNKGGFSYARSFLDEFMKYDSNYNYFVLPSNDVPGYFNQSGSGDARGYIIFIYSMTNANNTMGANQDFTFATFNDFYGGYYDSTSYFDNSFSFNACKVQSLTAIGIYNKDSKYISRSDALRDNYIPLCIYNYSHPVYFNSIFDYNNGSAQVSNAINNQTNTIKEETQKQTNAVVSATQSQTNQLLDTNNTGNETMSVNDTTTDTSADLSSIYNNISSAFTSYDPTISWGKDFVFTLPNGDNFTINLDSSLILNFLEDYPVLKAFYQSIFWVIFGGYVIFDFKKIINKMKEGNIDNVVGTSSPVDSVVNMSLK